MWRWWWCMADCRHSQPALYFLTSNLDPALNKRPSPHQLHGILCECSRRTRHRHHLTTQYTAFSAIQPMRCSSIDGA